MAQHHQRSWIDDEDDLEAQVSLDDMRKTSASLNLQESNSCSRLLACGLLPDELDELESGGGLPACAVEAPLRELSLLDMPSDPSPLTPGGAEAAAPAASRSQFGAAAEAAPASAAAEKWTGGGGPSRTVSDSATSVAAMTAAAKAS